MFDDGQVRTVNAIDRSSPLPLYYQLKRILLRRIQDGNITPDKAIPSETELQERYGVSRITVRRALSDLASEGYISRQPGRGTFVLRSKLQTPLEKIGFGDSLVAQGFKVEWQILRYGLQPAPHRVAQKLNVDECQPLLYFQRLVYADDEPIVLAKVYVNIGEEMTFTREEINSGSVYPLLERKYGVSLRHANRTIEATVALEEEARLLHTKVNMPMLLVESIVYDEQDQPIVFVKALCRGDRYKYYCTPTR
jgi:GntR family transcriptional regulator